MICRCFPKKYPKLPSWLERKIEHRLPICLFNLKWLASQPTWPSIGSLVRKNDAMILHIVTPESGSIRSIISPSLGLALIFHENQKGVWWLGVWAYVGPSYSNHLSPPCPACQGIEFIESWTKHRRLGSSKARTWDSLRKNAANAI